MRPRSAVRTLQKLICFCIIYYQTLLWIVYKGTPYFHRHISQNTTGCGYMTLLNISNRPASAFNSALVEVTLISHSAGPAAIPFARTYTSFKRHDFTSLPTLFFWLGTGRVGIDFGRL